SGAGDFVAATWTGGADPSRPVLPPGAPELAAGTCEAPLVLAAGLTLGSTRRGESELTASCASSDARELVYRLELPRRQRVVVTVESEFDSVLYLRKDDCEDDDAEIACNDDASQGPKRARSQTSQIDEVLDAG